MKRGWQLWLIIISLYPASALAESTLKERVFDAILDEGWSDKADDNGMNEKVPGATVVDVIRAYKSALHTKMNMAALCAMKDRPADCNNAEARFVDATDALGELTLAISVAEWGIAWDGAAPRDPDRRGWAGPKDITVGKHVMSYALGGLGLPHLDTGKAEALFGEISRRFPAAEADLRRFRQGFRYDPIRAKGGLCIGRSAVIMTDLMGEPFRHDAVTWGGRKYCDDYNPKNQTDAKQWQVLRTWARVGLRNRDVQQWIIDYWLHTVWHPTLVRLEGQKNATQEAFVVARIWSTSQGAANAALKAAGIETDPRKRLEKELKSYGHQRRSHVMQRLASAYDGIDNN